MPTTFFLPGSFAMQSMLPMLKVRTLTARRRMVTLLILAAMATSGFAIAQLSRGGAGFAFGLGLAAPGVGFAAPMLTMGELQLPALVCLLASLAAFGLALLLWFGTGNVLAPPIVWIGTAILAAWQARLGPEGPAHVVLIAGSAAPLAVLAGMLPRRSHVEPVAAPAPTVAEPCAELNLETLQLQRLLLDRALQPVEAFEGFEWRDQFQTAAVRYQLNFMSYALSLAQAHQLQAFSGYLVEAQRMLLAKQSDPRMWRYWRLESAWGHLRSMADPVPRDNIMYTGFVAAQIAFAEAAGGRSLAQAGAHLRLRLGGHDVDYTLADLSRILADQYRRASWGLLACEPHWIYPLCNLITACGLRTDDPELWAELAPAFREGLRREFMTGDGRIVPFRSSLTGLAFPAAGGIVMQAFPCLFLNAVFPDLAEATWARVRARLASGSWSRAFWPIDVGNYGFSRASSLAASAAAAVEMGNGANAEAMLERLDAECPSQLIEGVRHRPRASLWSHGLELAARCNRSGGLAALARTPSRQNDPYLAEVPYPAVLVARAVADQGCLDLVVHPGQADGPQWLTLGGLRPTAPYRVEGTFTGFIHADEAGMARLKVPLAGRTTLRVLPHA
jgi:hypothetical protein